MHLLSPFKILPLHIVELIVEYVAGSSRLKFDDVYKGSEEYAKLLMPLLDTCPSLCSPVFTRLFGVYRMQLNISDEYRTRSSWLQTYARDIGLPAHLYAKELAIRMDMLDVYSGDALKELSGETYINCTFPKVRSIKFVLSDSPEPEEPTFIAITSPDIKSTISAFVQRIRQMTPMMKEICISQAPSRYGEFQNSFKWLDNLVAQLSQHAIDIDYLFFQKSLIVDQRLSGLRNLVYSSFDYADGGEQIMELARRNASTLQLLKINLNSITVITGLIQNVDGSYAQYPCLHTFKLSCQRDSGVPQWPEFPGAVPFPRLRCLDIGMVNPFGGDTPFRGNAATLESLTLLPDSTIFRILREGKVFTPTSHPKLQQVNLGLNLEFEPNLFGTDVEYLPFVLSIGANAPVRTITDSLTGPDFRSLIPVFGEHTCIQVLTLDYTHLHLWNVIALVTALPLLSDLHTPLPVLGPWPDGVAEHELFAYVIANYAPTGRRFRCWHLQSVLSDNIENAVCCVLLLALVCPNFNYAAIGGTSCELFMALMSQMIATDGFRPHASRLRRLLFGGSKNEIRSVKSVLAAEEAVRARVARYHMETDYE
ncbi:hypothetical protein GGI19_006210 [Coemansia pectinata]|uniref:Uncharacterized protein n=1 Tax=Coemansia pectinata TaxID=1052879 RepID=A0A9W8L7R8_9FUNG|nr:hypothetical protein GGI19_006210 [Coemansia pectinata]